ALGPRINAAGRLADMSIGIECLLTDDADVALARAAQLDALNRERRAIEEQMQLDADIELQETDLAGRRSIVLFNDAWHPGVIGLVAARIKERHHRPTIAFARVDEGTLRGSGRSIEGVHLRDTLDLVTKAAPSLIEKFGGHALAAGLTLKAAHFEPFCRAFEAALRASSDAALFERTVLTDGPLAPQDFTLGLVESLERQIWGQGFAAPLFDNEFVVVEQRLVKDEHLRLTLELAGRRLPAIWFRRSEPLPSRARLAYRLAADEYQGLRGVQLLIEHAA
ncbi:MAG: DHHA1 domain-containing protein, partial [Burkholderiaceae bacterium]|nr:DHHA1 domain-containing protein [Burkholderiaceae bacterium]